MTYHVVLFTKNNCSENKADQKNQKTLTGKSVQQADLTKESQAKSHQENKTDQIALTRESYSKNKADQKTF